MGLTRSSMGSALLNDEFQIEKKGRVVALAGNPNVGKSTVFNALTGLKQHTGNWPGKTIENATGYYEFRGKSYTLVDIPGTYSLLANSKEEEIARDFICFGDPDMSIVVALCCFFRSNRIILKILFSFHQLNIPTRLDQAALNRLIKLPFAHFHHFFNIAYLQIQ